MTLRPDGRLTCSRASATSGTHSVFDLARAAADVLAMPWRKSRSSGATPASTCPGAAFRQPDDARDDARQLRWRDGREAKLREIAAMDLGGSPDDYDVGNERVFVAALPIVP